MEHGDKLQAWDYSGLISNDILRPENADTLLMLLAFWYCDGSLSRDKRGYHARAYAHYSWKLAPLLKLGGSRISIMKKGRTKHYRWGSDRRQNVEWLEETFTKVFKLRVREPALDLCVHCGAEDGRHEKECGLL